MYAPEEVGTQPPMQPAAEGDQNNVALSLVGQSWNGGTIIQGENGNLIWVGNSDGQMPASLPAQQYH